MRAEIVPIVDDGRDWPEGVPAGVGVAVRLNTRVEYRHVLPEVVGHVLRALENAETAGDDATAASAKDRLNELRWFYNDVLEVPFDRSRSILLQPDEAEAVVSGLLRDSPELFERDQAERRSRLAIEMSACMGAAWGGLTGVSGLGCDC